TRAATTAPTAPSATTSSTSCSPPRNPPSEANSSPWTAPSNPSPRCPSTSTPSPAPSPARRPPEPAVPGRGRTGSRPLLHAPPADIGRGMRPSPAVKPTRVGPRPLGGAQRGSAVPRRTARDREQADRATCRSRVRAGGGSDGLRPGQRGPAGEFRAVRTGPRGVRDGGRRFLVLDPVPGQQGQRPHGLPCSASVERAPGPGAVEPPRPPGGVGDLVTGDKPLIGAEQRLEPDRGIPVQIDEVTPILQVGVVGAAHGEKDRIPSRIGWKPALRRGIAVLDRGHVEESGRNADTAGIPCAERAGGRCQPEQAGTVRRRAGVRLDGHFVVALGPAEAGFPPRPLDQHMAPGPPGDPGGGERAGNPDDVTRPQVRLHVTLPSA